MGVNLPILKRQVIVIKQEVQMKKYTQKQKEEMNKVSRYSLDYSNNYTTIEQKVGMDTEQKALSLFSYLSFDSVEPTSPDSISNHELKADIWVQIGNFYFPFQIKSSETGKKKHNGLLKVFYTDKRGVKIFVNPPPCLVLNKNKRGFDFLKEVVNLFREDGYEIFLNQVYFDAYNKYKLLKSKTDFLPIGLIQAGKVNLNSSQLKFLVDIGFISREVNGYKI
jgi:hypothetical protein